MRLIAFFLNTRSAKLTSGTAAWQLEPAVVMINPSLYDPPKLALHIARARRFG